MTYARGACPTRCGMEWSASVRLAITGLGGGARLVMRTQSTMVRIVCASMASMTTMGDASLVILVVVSALDPPGISASSVPM